MSRRLVEVLAAAALVVTVAACGSTNVASPTRTLPPGTTTTTNPPNTVCTPTAPVTPAEGKPTVTVPEGAAPTTLQTSDIKVGDGPEAKAGDTVRLHYVGVSKTTGKEFDASWTRGEPITLQLGAGQVIPGWDQGIPGLKVGGRRQLVIPPDLAYGAQSPSPDIAANDTLIFVVDLVQVCKAAPAGDTTGTTVAGAAPTTAAGTPTTAAASTTASTAAPSTTVATPSTPTSAPPSSVPTTTTTAAR